MLSRDRNYIHKNYYKANTFSRFILTLTILNTLTSRETVEHCNMTLWKHDEQGNIYGNMFCKPIPEFGLSELM